MKRRSFVAWCLGAVPFLKGLVGGECKCCEDGGAVEITSIGPVPKGWKCPERDVAIITATQGPHGWVTQEVGRAKVVEVAPGEYKVELTPGMLRHPGSTTITVEGLNKGV